LHLPKSARELAAENIGELARKAILQYAAKGKVYALALMAGDEGLPADIRLAAKEKIYATGRTFVEELTSNCDYGNLAEMARNSILPESVRVLAGIAAVNGYAANKAYYLLESMSRQDLPEPVKKLAAEKRVEISKDLAERL
jgi:hypothetical protein